MKKQELIQNFGKNHLEFVDSVNSLTQEEFCRRINNSWTPGQHLEHILLTIIPLQKALFSKEYIRENFGEIDRNNMDQDFVIKSYLNTSLQAPEKYIPKDVPFENKTTLNQKIQETVSTIQNLLEKYTDNELNQLTLPHPLLGKLSLKEMFILMTYHPLHHLKKVKNE